MATILEWFKGANLQNILDNLYAKGKIQPIIVVMPNDCAMKDDRSVGNIMASDKVQAFATFEKDLLDDLIPFIEKKYPALTDKDSRAIAGASPKFRGNSFYYWTYRAKNG